MGWKGYVILFLFLAIVVFAAQNYEMVEVSFLLWSFKASRAIVLFFTLAIGIVIGTLIPRKKVM